MKKKFISIVVILTMLLTIPGTAAIAAVNGSTPSNWAVPEIEKAKGYGLVTAKVLGNYQQSITREEFCELAVKLYEALSGNTAPLPALNRFTDTNNQEILKAYTLGIVNGVNTAQTLFDPKANVNREQIAVMFYRTLQAVDSSLIKGSYFITFVDGNRISSWALDAIGFMNGNGIIGGVGGNRLDPLGPATREQGIALVKRTYEKFKDSVNNTSELYVPPMKLEPAVIQATPAANGYEIYQEINPENGTVKVVSGVVAVTVPSVNLTGSKVLSVKKADNIVPAAGLDFVQAYDIQLGNQTGFFSPVEIEITMPQSKPYSAFYYNTATGLWEDILYEQSGRIITIKTNHLSRFAVAEKRRDGYHDPMAKVWYYHPDFYAVESISAQAVSGLGAVDLDKLAFNKGWDAAKKWFDISTIASEIADGTLPGFSTLNDTIGKMGKVIGPIQLYFDIKNGKHTDAAAGAYEMALGSMIARFGEAGANIGLLGASIINMSIKEFAQAAISSKESQYEKAYAYYYDKNNSLNRKIKIRDGKDWYDVFYNIVETSPKYLNERINADIERYVRAIWSDTELLTAQGIIGQQGNSSTIVGGGAYLNDDLMERLSNNYTTHLAGYLNGILNKVIDDYDWNERKKFKKDYADKVVAELNREYTVTVKVSNNEGQSVNVQFNEPYRPGWEGFTDNQGNWQMTFTMLGYLRAGAPKKIYARDGFGNLQTKDFNLNMTNIVFGDEQLIEVTAPGTVAAGEKLNINVSKNGEAYPYSEIVSANPVLSQNRQNSTFQLNVPAQSGTYDVQVKDARTNHIETVKISVQESGLITKAKNDIALFNFGHDFEPLNYQNLYVKTAYPSSAPGYLPIYGNLMVQFYRPGENGKETPVCCIYYDYKDSNNQPPSNTPVDQLIPNDFSISAIYRFDQEGKYHGRFYIMETRGKIQDRTNIIWRLQEFNRGTLVRYTEFITNEGLYSYSFTGGPSLFYGGRPLKFETYQYDPATGGSKIMNSGRYVAESEYEGNYVVHTNWIWTGDPYDEGFDYSAHPWQ
ncbi:MAG: hypothetical protein GXY17_05450 [Clostridiaceae bacterium]|nr:hypothetical protein [Clostridiaceae bacterium]